MRFKRKYAAFKKNWNSNVQKYRNDRKFKNNKLKKL